MDWTDNSLQGHEIFLSSKGSKQAQGPTQSPVHWILGVVSADIKQPEHEAEHSTDVTNEWNSFVTLYMPWFAQGQVYLFCIVTEITNNQVPTITTHDFLYVQFITSYYMFGSFI